VHAKKEGSEWLSRLIVVKVGTSGITTNEGNVDEEEIERLADQIAAAMKGAIDCLGYVWSRCAGLPSWAFSPKPKTWYFSRLRRLRVKAFSWLNIASNSRDINLESHRFSSQLRICQTVLPTCTLATFWNAPKTGRSSNSE